MAGPDIAWERRRRIIRDVSRFQLKLMLDALRDLIMSPWSLVAGAIDVLKAGRQEPEHFAEVIQAGRKTEAWIDLWDQGKEHATAPTASVDQVIERLEEALKGAQANPEQLQRLRSWLQQRLDARAGLPPPPPADPR